MWSHLAYIAGRSIGATCYPSWVCGCTAHNVTLMSLIDWFVAKQAVVREIPWSIPSSQERWHTHKVAVGQDFPGVTNENVCKLDFRTCYATKGRRMRTFSPGPAPAENRVVRKGCSTQAQTTRKMRTARHRENSESAFRQ